MVPALAQKSQVEDAGALLREERAKHFGRWGGTLPERGIRFRHHLGSYRGEKIGGTKEKLKDPKASNSGILKTQSRHSHEKTK